MSRAFCIPGVIFLLCALVLNLLVSISLPFLRGIDIARTNNLQGASVDSSADLTQIRFGVWAPCYYNGNGDSTCRKSGHGYNVGVTSQDKTDTANIKAAWTRGLAVHPVATAATLVAFLLGLSTHLTVTLIASLVSFLAALLTLIAFAIDIALFVLVKNEMKKFGNGVNTNTGAGFWMTFVAFILLLLAGCTVCFGRRRERLSGATTTSSYPMRTKAPFWHRFRRNKI
ncbi:SUR7/PalI family-domain-containing protein [Crassisporium funariophilum]|nr:SUR7/PalI family-domain-containing protein [Crassisporium funariophilum]